MASLENQGGNNQSSGSQKSSIPKATDSYGWVGAIDEIVSQCQAEWIDHRRHLHKYPELSGHEHATTRYLAEAIEKMGLVPQIVGSGRGMTVDYVSSSEAAERQRLALRGDIDALPITDGKSVDYKSTCEGVMHACGHDVHATIVLAALQILSRLGKSGQLPWPVVLRGLLQPSEETAEGAKYMIHHHALRDVKAILALHVDPTRGVGHVGLCPGVLTAAADIIEIEVTGRGGHGARPHLCHDPIDAATMWNPICVPHAVSSQSAIRNGRIVDWSNRSGA